MKTTGLLVVHAAFPEIKIDAVSVALLIAAILPWLSSIITSAEFPGGWKIEFRDLKRAGDKVTQGTAVTPLLSAVPAYVSVADMDPNLALVGLRIEIEKRLRSLAERHQLRPNRSLLQLLRQLRDEGALNDPSVSGLQELINAGNQAAHGASVDKAAADWASEYGPIVLAVLDQKLVD